MIRQATLESIAGDMGRSETSPHLAGKFRGMKLQVADGFIARSRRAGWATPAPYGLGGRTRHHSAPLAAAFHSGRFLSAAARFLPGSEQRDRKTQWLRWDGFELVMRPNNYCDRRANANLDNGTSTLRMWSARWTPFFM